MSLQSAASGANVGAAQQESSRESRVGIFCMYKSWEMRRIWRGRLGFQSNRGVWVTVADLGRTKVDPFVGVCLEGRLVLHRL